MTTNNSTSKRLAAVAIGSFFLWACSDTPKPTASGSSETQEKVLASEGGDILVTSTDTLDACDVGTEEMAEMHTAMAQDSLCAEGMMAATELDSIHAVDMGDHGEVLMEEMHAAMAQDSLCAAGAMAGTEFDSTHAVDMGDRGEALMAEMHTAMAQDSLHAGESQTIPSVPQTESPTGDIHGH